MVDTLLHSGRCGSLWRKGGRERKGREQGQKEKERGNDKYKAIGTQ